MRKYFFVRTDLFDFNFSRNTIMMFLTLCKFANKDGECFPSRKTICEYADCEISTYKKGINRLVRERMIKRDKRYRECGGQTSNLFSIINEGPSEFMIYDRILDSGLSVNAICVYAYLCCFAEFFDNEYYPFTKEMAQKCRMTEIEVIKALREIRNSGINKIEIDSLPTHRMNEKLFENIFKETHEEELEGIAEEDTAYFWFNDFNREDYIYQPCYLENENNICHGCINCNRCIFKWHDDKYLCVKRE